MGTSEDEVKAASRDQRDAEAGEPTCVICGRYGEYICDETDEDVCSLECKATALKYLEYAKVTNATPLVLGSGNASFRVTDKEVVKGEMPEWKPNNGSPLSLWQKETNPNAIVSASQYAKITNTTPLVVAGWNASFHVRNGEVAKGERPEGKSQNASPLSLWKKETNRNAIISATQYTKITNTCPLVLAGGNDSFHARDGEAAKGEMPDRKPDNGSPLSLRQKETNPNAIVSASQYAKITNTSPLVLGGGSSSFHVRDGEVDKGEMLEWKPSSGIPLSLRQMEELRTELGILVKGGEEEASSPPPLILDFSECNFWPRLLENLELAGYGSPTPVQMQAIPAALKGRDVLVSADTGSGKTACFLLPVIHKCCLVRKHLVPERNKPLAMIVTPTRELCIQVETQAKALGKGLPFKTALVVGGEAMPQQVYRLRKGVELLVGTPGRLIDLLAKHPLDLNHVCMLVLDEVDCMLEHGFRDEVAQIVLALSRPQVLLFSATIPPPIERLAGSILKRPLKISVGSPGLANVAVQQTVIWTESKNKKKKLFEILQSPRHFHPPVVVFVNSKVGADLLADAIRTVTGLEAAAIHGEKPMKERKQVLGSFLAGDLPVLVATGVLGRGLDLVRVRQVVVFDMPATLPEYVHQIGRASRLGVAGTAMVFINNESRALFQDFIQLLRSSGAAIPRELMNSPYTHSTYAQAYNSRKRKHNV